MDTELKKELAVFMHNFEWTFGEDWDHGQMILGIPDSLQHKDFLDPDCFSNWESHATLIDCYKRLKAAMRAQNVSIEELL